MNITIGQASSITVFSGKGKIVVKKVNDITFNVFPQKGYNKKEGVENRKVCNDKARKNRSVRFNTNYISIDKELYPRRPIKKDLNSKQLDRELEEYHKECCCKENLEDEDCKFQ